MDARVMGHPCATRFHHHRTVTVIRSQSRDLSVRCDGYFCLRYIVDVNIRNGRLPYLVLASLATLPREEARSLNVGGTRVSIIYTHIKESTVTFTLYRKQLCMGC